MRIGTVVGWGWAAAWAWLAIAAPVQASEGATQPESGSSFTTLRLEADAIGIVGTLPRPLYGGDLSFALGRPRVHVRIGVVSAGTQSIALARGPGARRLGFVVEAAQLQVCAAGHKRVHRVRLCGGGQAGVLHLNWHDRPSREMPWVTANLHGDYAIALGRFFELHAGLGLTVPIVGTRIDTHARGVPQSLRTEIVGSVVRIGLGLRLR